MARNEAHRTLDTLNRYIAEHPPVAMPEITLDQDFRLTDLKWNLGRIESGASVEFAIPLIARLGVGVMHITSEEGGLDAYLEIDFAGGRIREISQSEFVSRQRPGGPFGLN